MRKPYDSLGHNFFTLGKICQEIWPEGNIPDTIINIIFNTPDSDLNKITNHEDAVTANQSRLSELKDQLTSDLYDPLFLSKNSYTVPDNFEEAFWNGYYEHLSELDMIKGYGPNELQAAGNTLFDSPWQTSLARALGFSDARRIRQWMAKSRPIPNSLWTSIAGLLQIRKMKINRKLYDLTQG